MPRKSTSIYKNSNATPEDVEKVKEWAFRVLNEPLSKTVGNPYALVFGVRDSKGRTKLFKYCKLFGDPERFEAYLFKHKQPVLAVYDKNRYLD